MLLVSAMALLWEVMGVKICLNLKNGNKSEENRPHSERRSFSGAVGAALVICSRDGAESVAGLLSLHPCVEGGCRYYPILQMESLSSGHQIWLQS